MKRFIPVVLIVLMAVVSLGFRGGYWRGARTVAGDYTFSDAVDFNSVVDINDASLWIKGDTLFFTDGGADTSFIVQNGTNLKIGSDNEVYFGHNIDIAGGLIKNSASMTFKYDTLAQFGADSKKPKEIWGKRHMGTDPTLVDSFSIYDDGTNTVIDSDNEAKFTNSVMFGGVGVAVDSVKVNGGNLEFYVDGNVYNAAAP